MRLSTLAFAVAVLASGCMTSKASIQQPPVVGPPQFLFVYCLNANDCSLAGASVAAGGAHSWIEVQNPPKGWLEVASSDVSVATVSTNDNRSLITVVSGAPGQTELRLLDDGGAVLAAATLTVVATSELRVNKGWGGDVPRILAGVTRNFHVTTYDAGGHVTSGSGAVHFALSPSLTAGAPPAYSDAVAFSSAVAGSGTITASCPDAKVTQDVEIVAAGELTELTTAVTGGINGQGVGVLVTPQTADGPVYGACSWQLSDPSIVQQPDFELLPGSLDLGPTERAYFSLPGTAHYTATCTMGSLTKTIALN